MFILIGLFMLFFPGTDTLSRVFGLLWLFEAVQPLRKPTDDDTPVSFRARWSAFVYLQIHPLELLRAFFGRSTKLPMKIRSTWNEGTIAKNKARELKVKNRGSRTELAIRQAKFDSEIAESLRRTDFYQAVRHAMASGHSGDLAVITAAEATGEPLEYAFALMSDGARTRRTFTDNVDL